MVYSVTWNVNAMKAASAITNHEFQEGNAVKQNASFEEAKETTKKKTKKKTKAKPKEKKE